MTDGFVLKGTMTEISNMLNTLKLFFPGVTIKDITRMRRWAIILDAEKKQFGVVENECLR